MQPLRHSFGGLHAEPVDEQLLGELSVGLEPGHQLGHFVARRDRLQRNDVDLAGAERPVEVGQADPVVPRLAREYQPLQFPLTGARRDPT